MFPVSAAEKTTHSLKFIDKIALNNQVLLKLTKARQFMKI
jgi:hypothetical protein